MGVNHSVIEGTQELGKAQGPTTKNGGKLLVNTGSLGYGSHDLH